MSNKIVQDASVYYVANYQPQIVIILKLSGYLPKYDIISHDTINRLSVIARCATHTNNGGST